MSDWSNGWPAPAKLNLLLRITGRRDDGYHLLQTVFQFVQQADLIDLRVRADGEIHRVSELEGVPEDSDLVVKAARLLQQQAQTTLGADIRVHKQLPMGGGLGGGSSDAATVLCALNHLWDCGLSNDELAKLGLQLGADVPVFVHGQATWAEGVGEKFTPIELPEPWYLVLVPDVSISTAEVFSHPDLTRDSTQITIRAFLDGERSNDCLNVVKKTSPEISQAIDWLDNFSEARLTGTGACIFAEFDSENAAREIWQKLPENLTGFVTKGCNVSPLKERLANS